MHFFFLCFSEHPSHAPVGYGEIPKSCTMENRQNLIEHQLYATIQRKQPPVPPFTTDTPAARKGFDTNATVERFKRLNNGDLCPYVQDRPAKAENGLGGQGGIGHGLGGHGGHHRGSAGLLASTSSRCATLGRMKNLEMTEYQQQKFYNGAHNIVSWCFYIRVVKFSKILRSRQIYPTATFWLIFVFVAVFRIWSLFRSEFGQFLATVTFGFFLPSLKDLRFVLVISDYVWF